LHKFKFQATGGSNFPANISEIEKELCSCGKQSISENLFNASKKYQEMLCDCSDCVQFFKDLRAEYRNINKLPTEEPDSDYEPEKEDEEEESDEDESDEDENENSPQSASNPQNQILQPSASSNSYLPNPTPNSNSNSNSNPNSNPTPNPNPTPNFVDLSCDEQLIPQRGTKRSQPESSQASPTEVVQSTPKKKRVEEKSWEESLLKKNYRAQVCGFFSPRNGLENAYSDDITQFLSLFEDRMSEQGIEAIVTDWNHIKLALQEFFEDTQKSCWMRMFIVHRDNHFSTVIAMITPEGNRVFHYDPAGLHDSNFPIVNVNPLYGRLQTDAHSCGYIAILCVLRTLFFIQKRKKKLESEEEIIRWMKNNAELGDTDLESAIEQYLDFLDGSEHESENDYESDED